MALTNLKCQNAKPESKKYKLFDGKGLYLEIRPNGAKYWRLKYRFLGKEKLLALGVFPEISLNEARGRCLEARKHLDQNTDPSSAKKQAIREAKANAETTFKVVALEWHELNKNRWSKNYAYKALKGLELNVFPFIGNRPIKEITPPELLTGCLRRIEKRGSLDIAVVLGLNKANGSSHRTMSVTKMRDGPYQGATIPFLIKNYGIAAAMVPFDKNSPEEVLGTSKDRPLTERQKSIINALENSPTNSLTQAELIKTLCAYLKETEENSPNLINEESEGRMLRRDVKALEQLNFICTHKEGKTIRINLVAKARISGPLSHFNLKSHHHDLEYVHHAFRDIPSILEKIEPLKIN